MKNVIKEISTKHKSYLQYTPHFLREFDKINWGPNLLNNAMRVTLYLTGAYPNITQEDGLSSLHEAFKERSC